MILPCNWATLRWNSASLNSGVFEMLTAALFVAEVRALLANASLFTAGALLLERELRGVVVPVPLLATPAPIPAEARAVLSSVLELELALAGPATLVGMFSGRGALLLDRELRGVELRLRRPLEATPTARVGVTVPAAELGSVRAGFVREATGVDRLSAVAAALAAIAALLPLSMCTTPPALASSCLLRYQLSIIRNIRATCSVTYRFPRSSCSRDLATTSTILQRVKEELIRCVNVVEDQKSTYLLMDCLHRPYDCILTPIAAATGSEPGVLTNLYLHLYTKSGFIFSIAL